MNSLKFIKDTDVLDMLKTSFEMEISNKTKLKDDCIVVYLKDGTKAMIKTKSIQLKELLWKKIMF